MYDIRHGTVRINNAASGFTTSTTTSIVATPGAGKRLVVDKLQLSTDASGQFTGIALVDATSTGTIMSVIWAMLGSDFVNTGPLYNLRFAENKPICLQRTAVAGTLYYDIEYHIEG